MNAKMAGGGCRKNMHIRLFSVLIMAIALDNLFCDCRRKWHNKNGIVERCDVFAHRMRISL